MTRRLAAAVLILAAGLAADARLILPLDESTNFVLSAAGGYYFLVGTNVSFSGTNQALNGSAWGGRGGADLEFLLDEQKNSAIDVGGGYRLLSFNATGASQTATLGFTGPVLDLGLKFYFGKD